MAVKSLQVMFLGQDSMDKGKLAFRQDGKKIDIPFLSFLIRTDDKNILFDTGMHPDNAAFIAAQGRATSVTPENHLPAKLKEAAGLSMDDIDTVILSHLDRDHAGWIGEFKNAEVIVQKDEYTAAAVEPAPYYNPVTPVKSYAERDVRWKLIIGDEVLMPGLTLFTTPGHTIGHQSLMVDLPQTGTVILTADAFLDLECLEKEIIPGVYTDRMAAYKSLKKIKMMVKLTNALVFPTHDMEYYQNHIKKSPEAYL